MNENDNLTEEQAHQLLTEVFFQRGKDREKDLEPSVGQLAPKLVHYTSANTAQSILTAKGDDRCLWLRNATEMNDFSEVAFGQQMLINALNDSTLQSSFLSACRDVNPEIEKIFSLMSQEFQTIKLNTYLLSLSLHRNLDLEIGKLSMWRAYGGSANVCLVFNTEAFANNQTAYDVTISGNYILDVTNGQVHKHRISLRRLRCSILPTRFSAMQTRRANILKPSIGRTVRSARIAARQIVLSA